MSDSLERIEAKLDWLRWKLLGTRTSCDVSDDGDLWMTDVTPPEPPWPA